MGYQTFYYELHDHPNRLEAVVEALTEQYRAILEVVCGCPVGTVEVGANYDEQMTSIDIAATRKLWGDQVAMWGGLPSVVFTSSFSDEAFERHLETLFSAVAPGDRFILGFGDNVPTDAFFERVVRVAPFWRDNGSYPLRA